MVDIMTPAQRSELMRRIRGVDTKPELFVRRALHALGYRFRTHARELPGCPDLVFPGRRTAVFVHGCFWHRHGCKKTYVPKSRRQFWETKFDGNIARDKRDQELLAMAGWRFIVVWECEVESDDAVLDRIVEFVGPPRMPRDGQGRAWSGAQ